MTKPPNRVGRRTARQAAVAIRQMGDRRRGDEGDPVPNPVFQRAVAVLKEVLHDPEWYEHARWITGATVDASGPGPSRPPSRRSPRPGIPPQVLALEDVAKLLNVYAQGLLRVSRGASDPLFTVEHEVLRLVRELVAVLANGENGDTKPIQCACGLSLLRVCLECSTRGRAWSPTPPFSPNTQMRASSAAAKRARRSLLTARRPQGRPLAPLDAERGWSVTVLARADPRNDNFSHRSGRIRPVTDRAEKPPEISTPRRRFRRMSRSDDRARLVRDEP